MVHSMELFEYELYQQGKSRHTVRSYLSRVRTFKTFVVKIQSLYPMLDTAVPRLCVLFGFVHDRPGRRWCGQL